MFCSQCGNKIGSNQNFCSKCGNKILPTSNNISTCYAQANGHIPLPKKTNTKKIFVGVGIAISIVLVVCIICSIISDIVPKQVDFDLQFDQVKIQEFMDIVCENTDVESAQVGQVGLDGVGISYGDYISATVTVKQHGMMEEELEVRFYNSGDTDNVSSIVVYFYDHDSENETACRDAIVEALEISFCGSSKAKEYTDQFSSIGEDLTIYDDTQIITSYFLTSEANVRISCDGSFADEWTGIYCIYKN